MRRAILAAILTLPAASAFAFNPQPDPPSQLNASQLGMKGACPAGIICCCSGKPRFMLGAKALRGLSRPAQPKLLLPAK